MKPKTQRHQHLKRTPRKPTYAFIDSQNIVRGTREAGWSLDWTRFRRHLRTRFNVDKALLFIGFIEGNRRLYKQLSDAGFTLVFKPTVPIRRNGRTVTKGNVDTDLVLHALLEKDRYDGAVLVSGDGDFRSLADHLEQAGKLRGLIVPSQRSRSKLLKRFDRKTVSMDGIRGELRMKN